MFFFCYISWWNIRAWASWNFDLVQLFLISWSANCFARHAWFALSVLCHDRKFLLEAVGILGLYIYSSWIGLHIVFLGTHGVLCLFYFVLEKKLLEQLEFWDCAILLHQLYCTMFFYACMVCSVCFLSAGKFLLRAVGIFSFWNYSSLIVLHIDLVCMYVCSAFFFELESSCLGQLVF